MTTHGRVSFSDALRTKLLTLRSATGQQLAGAEHLIPGFRHFIETPGPARQFSIAGSPFEPSNEPQFDAAYKLMGKLAGILEREPMPGFNPRIPSGYTYFLQLVAHDLVQSSLFLSGNRGKSLGLGNIRRMPLRLETIYAGGPSQCPFAYESNGSRARDKLRLGRVRKAGCQYEDNEGDPRDIARARPTETLGGSKYPEALIADARNDSHVILSQLVVLFHHLHNEVLKRLKEGTEAPSGNTLARDQLLFVAAQAACTLIYRSIIRNDLLPLILHDEVLTAYQTGTVQVVDKPHGLDANDWLIPLEFSFGFFRFGHAMIRPKYSFNELHSIAQYRGFDVTSILKRSSERSPELMPLENVWTVDWQRFFDRNNADVNFSVRIGPWSRLDLENAVRNSDQRAEGLSHRDLISSISTEPWSVRALANKLRQTHQTLVQLSPYLAGELGDDHPPPWFDAIKTWLVDRNRTGFTFGPLTECEISTLATDPPIPFFARFEAGMDPKIEGRHLGVLASIVVADVFYGILEQDRVFGIDGKAALPDQLRQLSETMFEDKPDGFSDLDGLVTFNALIAF